MTVSEGKTIVLRVSVKSRLFLVGPALLAISVSGRAEGRGQDWRGPDFSFLQLASDKCLFFSSSSALTADNSSGPHHHLPPGFRPLLSLGFVQVDYRHILDSDCFKRLLGVNGLCLTR